jgi:tetratricopeptide (TPR) repeat protein
VGWYGCIAQNPNDWVALYNRADSHMRLGYCEEALADFEAAVAKSSASANRYDALSGLAFFLATTPEPSLRDGKRAVELAHEASELCNYKDFYAVDALAAAHAETEDFESAVAWARKALELADNDADRRSVEEHLKQFQARRPWRETSQQRLPSSPAPD